MNKLQEHSGGGIIKGVWFIFQEEGHTIKVWVSSFSGKEKVYLNNELVSDKRSVGLKSEHDFMIDGVNYSVHFEVKNLIKGKLLCSLVKNKIIIKKLQSKSRKTTFNIYFTLIIIFIFIAYAVLGMYIETSRNMLLMILIPVIFAKFLWGKEDFFIVEEV